MKVYSTPLLVFFILFGVFHNNFGMYWDDIIRLKDSDLIEKGMSKENVVDFGYPKELEYETKENNKCSALRTKICCCDATQHFLHHAPDDPPSPRLSNKFLCLSCCSCAICFPLLTRISQYGTHYPRSHFLFPAEGSTLMGVVLGVSMTLPYRLRNSL